MLTGYHDGPWLVIVMREIVLDTETTGLDIMDGHRLVEIGCVELVDRVVTGRTWNTFLNPRRCNHAEAFDIHRLPDAFLRKQPLFRERAKDLMGFLASSRLVMHNAAFDLAFLNNELVLEGMEPIRGSRAIDTLSMARSIFPGRANDLGALAQRLGIEIVPGRTHRALSDARLLAVVYIALLKHREDHA